MQQSIWCQQKVVHNHEGHIVHIRESLIRQSVSNNSGNESDALEGCGWQIDHSWIVSYPGEPLTSQGTDVEYVQVHSSFVVRTHTLTNPILMTLQNWVDWEHSILLRKLMYSSSIFLCDFMALQINSIDVIPLRSTALTKGFDRPLRMDRRGLIYDHDKERIAKSRKTMHRSLV